MCASSLIRLVSVCLKPGARTGKTGRTAGEFADLPETQDRVPSNHAASSLPAPNLDRTSDLGTA